jgi:hypothetical protein
MIRAWVDESASIVMRVNVIFPFIPKRFDVSSFQNCNFFSETSPLFENNHKDENSENLIHFLSSLDQKWT